MCFPAARKGISVHCLEIEEASHDAKKSTEIRKLPAGPTRDELRFDRTQFEPSGSPGNKYSQEKILLLETFGDVETEDEEGATTLGDGIRYSVSPTASRRVPSDAITRAREFRMLKAKILEAETLPITGPVQEALDRGEPWVARATPKNIFKLPRSMSISLLFRYWGGLTYKEIALECGWGTPDAARKAVDRAKKRLCHTKV
jgi:hypothetical protein